jgi:hypothetical protein
MFASLTLGSALLAASFAACLLLGLPVRAPIPSPEAQALLLLLVELLLFGLLPVLGLAFLFAAHGMWHYRSAMRREHAF